MLSEIMGDYPRVKVIEILITHPWSEYTKKDLSRASGISRRTLYWINWKPIRSLNLHVKLVVPSFTPLTGNQKQPMP